MGCHFLLQGIFPTQGSNLGLPHDRRILDHLSHQGSPDPGPVHSPQPNPLNIIPCSEIGNLSLPLAQATTSKVAPLFLRHPIFKSTFYPENRPLLTISAAASLPGSIALGQFLGGRWLLLSLPPRVLPAQGGYTILPWRDSHPGAPLSNSSVAQGQHQTLHPSHLSSYSSPSSLCFSHTDLLLFLRHAKQAPFARSWTLLSLSLFFSACNLFYSILFFFIEFLITGYIFIYSILSRMQSPGGRESILSTLLSPVLRTGGAQAFSRCPINIC